MIVFEKARELGELIRMTEQAVKRDDAMEAYIGDAEAVTRMKEYETLQLDIQVKMENNDFSQSEFNEATVKLRKMGSELKKHPVVGPYIDAVNDFNRMVNQVFGIIQKTALGGEGGCDCGGCDDGNCEEGCDCVGDVCGRGHSH